MPPLRYYAIITLLLLSHYCRYAIAIDYFRSPPTAISLRQRRCLLFALLRDLLPSYDADIAARIIHTSAAI